MGVLINSADQTASPYVLNVRIAEHLFRFRTVSANLHDELDSKFEKMSAKHDAYPQPDMTVDVEEGYGAPFVNYSVKTAVNRDLVVFKRQDYRIDADPAYRFARIRAYDGFALKHALMNLYSAFMTHRRWGLLIHSSCVADEGQAYLFAGHSGAGKSTAARLSAPREILSDEASIVRLDGDLVKVYPSPFRSDPDIPCGSQSRPLAGIHFLHQAREDRRLRIDASQGIVHLMDKVFYWAYHPGETMKVLEMTKRLAVRVPMYDLYFQKNAAFWEAIRAPDAFHEEGEPVKAHS